MCPRSDNWRINKSSLMAVEGAQALRALQKVAGAAGLPSSFKVKFDANRAGSYNNLDDHEISIGAGRIFDEAPIPAEKFDVLVGLTLHEVGHHMIGTQNVWNAVQRNYRSVTYRPDNDPEFQNFINIGEDIAIESRLAKNPNLTDYGDALFNWATSIVREAHPNKLMELWIEYGLLHKPDKLLNLPPELDGPMSQLAAFTAWLRHDHSYSERADAYVDYWESIKAIVKNPPKLPEPEKDKLGEQEDGTNEDQSEMRGSEPEEQGEDGDDDSMENWGKEKTDEAGSDEPTDNPESNETGDSMSESDSEDAEDEEEVEGTGEEVDKGDMENPYTRKPGDSIDQELADAIEDAMESDSEDITDEILDQFSGLTGHHESSCPIIRSRESKTPVIKPDQNLCKRLDRIMTIRKRLQARIMHGEQYGRIDKRHLHRVGTDGRVFNLKYKFPDGFPNTRILIDLSGSMSGRQADEVLQAAGALQTIANAEVWCYYHDHQTVALVRMDEGKYIHRYEPNGGTPSGLAIVGVALGMRPGGMVIHLTDGGHNYGQTPWNAHWILKKKGIELVNLIWGKDTKQFDIDGMNMRQLKGLGEFPDSLYNVLVEQAKLGNMGGC